MLSARIAAFLRDYGWGINLVFIALGAYFVAGAANAVVARSIRITPSIDDIAVAATTGSRAPTSIKREFSSMAERNLLAAKRENLNPVTAANAIGSGELQGCNFVETDLKACTMAATVRATLVAEDAPEWSMAVIVNNVDKEPTVYSINEGSNRIADDVALCFVRNREVVVRRHDHFEKCPVEGEGPNVATPTAVASVATPASDETVDGGPASTGGGEGVTKVSDTQFTVERAEVDKALGNLNEVATQARIVPSFKNGKGNGFKMFSIKPGSIYSKIGLQNGDVIQKINGYEMNSPDKALEIYQKLRDASTVSIELQRRGKNMNVNYNIR